MSSDLPQLFDAHGQGQVFRFFDALTPPQQADLLRQAASFDLAEINRLVKTLVLRDSHEAEPSDGPEPADFIPLPGHGGDANRWAEAEKAGVEALRAGRVAAFTVAGGQGTRLGFDGPKGTFSVTPVRRASLFQVFAEKIAAAAARYGRTVPWFVMTSDINHADTVAHFETNGFFGLDRSQVHFFSQGLMPAVDEAGKILLSGRSEIALSPDGHGGSLRALVRSGAIDRMEADGIDLISYFQVDNPLVRCLDPAFIGFHLLEGSEMSSKTVVKTNAAEKVGVFCREKSGQLAVIEYSNKRLEPLLERCDDDGQLSFRAGSIAVHVFDRDFVKRLGGDGEFALPFHPAHKKVPHLDEAGDPVNAHEPNGWKFEMLVFDALPFAKNPVVIETRREDDFSPVKNKEGADSPQTSHDDQLRQFAHWVRAAGLDLPVDATGLPPFAFEITPLFAETEAEFAGKWRTLAKKPEIREGVVIG
jgi:UDP-N-acetylglucosamine/UDP-N-acetylgalactosamine diphosphorylase